MTSTKIIDGNIEWWEKDGELHREDGPAVVFGFGGCQYWLHGKLHRVDGPAIITAGDDPSYSWCLNGVSYSSFSKWLAANTYVSQKQKTSLCLKWGMS